MLAVVTAWAAADLPEWVRRRMASARLAASRAGTGLLRHARRVRDGGRDRLRQRSGEHLVRGTILACAMIGLIRRTGVSGQIRRGGRRFALLARRAWAEAEGFEFETAAGVTLVVLSIVILLHGYLSG